MVGAHPEIPGLVDWRPLARGGFSTVWQAKQESLDRQVAVKVDHRPLSEEKERRRFLREAGAAGRLSGHAGIVTVHDAGILSDGRPYLVMDLCTGGSLTQWLKPEGRQTEQRIRDVGQRIADALAAAHARGVLHRDVKPANILIDSFGHPGLADFGLAALPEPGEELSVSLEGMTPAYAPREVFYLEPPTEFGDVYSLAATMYALLAGKPPRWPDTGTPPSLPQQLELQGQPIARLPQVNPGFMDVLLEALDDDARQRPTAAQFRDRLAGLTFAAPAVSSGSATVPAVAAAGPAPGTDRVDVMDTDGSRSTEDPRAGRRRRSLAVILSVAAVLVAVVVASLFNNRPPSGSAVTGPSTAEVSPVPPGGGPATSAEPSPTRSSKEAAPTVPPPDGFVDCSEQLGGKSYCVDPEQPECWVNYYSYADLTAVATMQECDAFHELQTFAAGELPVVVNRQSRFEGRKEVKALCTKETLEKVMVGKPLKDWQLKRLPVQVQIEGDNLFRCLVGPTRTEPHQLEVPRR